MSLILALLVSAPLDAEKFAAYRQRLDDRRWAARELRWHINMNRRYGPALGCHQRRYPGQRRERYYRRPLEMPVNNSPGYVSRPMRFQ